MRDVVTKKQHTHTAGLGGIITGSGSGSGDSGDCRARIRDACGLQELTLLGVLKCIELRPGAGIDWGCLEHLGPGLEPVEDW